MGQYGVFEPPAEPGNGLKKPTRKEPGRGMLDGIRKDLKAAKDAGEEYDPRGTGAAWNHNFLNKKPWHPLTFKNQARVWEAEHEDYEKEKRLLETRAEYEAEQAYLKTLSMLSPEEQERYRSRQQVAFLYQKPPGYDAALERAEQAKQQGLAVGPGGESLPQAGGGGEAGQAAGQAQQQGQQAGRGPGGPAGRQQQQQAGPGGHLQNVLGGMKAAQKQQEQRYDLKGTVPGGRSPPRGGGSLGAANQQFVVGEMDSEEEEEAIRLAFMPEAERRRLRKEEARRQRRAEKAAAAAAKASVKTAAAAQLDQAKAFLRAAGLALPSDDEGSSSSSSSSGDSGDGEEQGEAGHRASSGSAGGQAKRSSKSSAGRSKSRKHRKKEKKKAKRHRKD